MGVQHGNPEAGQGEPMPEWQDDGGLLNGGEVGIGILFRCAGQIWHIDHDGRQVSVKDSSGMRLLAKLVAQPGVDIHVLALASGHGAWVPESTAGEMLDDRARSAYRKRITEIAEQLAVAARTGDAGRTANLEHEGRALRAELARATGLGGRVRQTGSATERARVNAQKRIRGAIARIADVDAKLGRLLDGAVKTGTYCCFRP